MPSVAAAPAATRAGEPPPGELGASTSAAMSSSSTPPPLHALPSMPAFLSAVQQRLVAPDTDTLQLQFDLAPPLRRLMRDHGACLPDAVRATLSHLSPLKVAHRQNAMEALSMCLFMPCLTDAVAVTFRPLLLDLMARQLARLRCGAPSAAACPHHGAPVHTWSAPKRMADGSVKPRLSVNADDAAVVIAHDDAQLAAVESIFVSLSTMIQTAPHSRYLASEILLQLNTPFGVAHHVLAALDASSASSSSASSPSPSSPSSPVSAAAVLTPDLTARLLDLVQATYRICREPGQLGGLIQGTDVLFALRTFPHDDIALFATLAMGALHQVATPAMPLQAERLPAWILDEEHRRRRVMAQLSGLEPATVTDETAMEAVEPLVIDAAHLSPQCVDIGGIVVVSHRDADHPAAQPPVPLVMTLAIQQVMHRIAHTLMMEKPILLEGPPGCGKTSVIEAIAHQVAGDSLLKIYLGDQTDASLLLGSYISSEEPGIFKWQPGVLTTAVQEGRWILIEDIDLAPDEVLSILLPLLSKRELYIPSHNRTITAKPGFQIFSTRTTYASGSKAQIGRNLWEAVPLSSPSADEWVTILHTRFGLPPSWLQLWLAMFSDLVGETRAAMHKLSANDLVKFCRRVAMLQLPQRAWEGLPLHHKERVYLEAVDCFTGAMATPAATLSLLTILGRALGVPAARVDYFREEHAPTITDAGHEIAFGRATLPKCDNAYARALQSNHGLPFIVTTQAARTMEQLACCLQLRENVLLVGETGTGKTTTVQQMAQLTGNKLVVLNLSQQSESVDLVGSFKPVDESASFDALYHTFERVFGRTFPPEKNAVFLGMIGRARQARKWKQLLKGFQEACKKAAIALKSKRFAHDAERRASLTAEWDAFRAQVDKIGDSATASKLRFAYIEGILVQALRYGWWILLDEINLAPAETIECIKGVFESETGSVLLLERGDLEVVQRHPNFRLFACMNPATDAGKKQLSPGLDSRMTQFWIHGPDSNRQDLTLIVNRYLQDLPACTSVKVDHIVSFYLTIRDLVVNSRLYDGADQPVHFSLRTLTRALVFAVQFTPQFGLTRALYEAITMNFATGLSHASLVLVESLIHEHTLYDISCSMSSFLSILPAATRPEEETTLIGSFYLSRGDQEVPDDVDRTFIQTPCIARNKMHLARAAASGKYPVLIQGPTSAGKTSMVAYLAAKTGHRFVRVNNHDQTDLVEYIGGWQSEADGTLVFREGVLVQALRRGDWIVLDELNLAPTEVLEALNRLLDDNRELYLPETQETIRPHPEFMLFATQNPTGQYGGRKQLSRAFRNRFLEIHVGDIPPGELQTILSKRCAIAPSHAQKLVRVFKETQAARTRTKIFDGKTGLMTLRDLFRWANRDVVTVEDLACEGALLLAGKMRTLEEQQLCIQIIEKEFKVKVDLQASIDAKFNDLIQKIDATLLAQHRVVMTDPMKRLLVLVHEAAKYEEPVLLVGETGGGKTTVCQLVAALAGRSLAIVNAHYNSDASDFIGGLRPVRDSHAAPEPGSAEASAETAPASRPLFQWVDGPLTQAMRSGNYFLLDEISLANDSVLERLNSVLEPGRSILLTEKGTQGPGADSDFIHAHGDFRFLATMNPGGDYGKKELSPALRNRFTEIWVGETGGRRNTQLILQQQTPRLADDVITAMLDFLDWWVDHIPATQLILSIRDVLAWTQFFHKTAARIGTSAAFWEGGLLVFIDSLTGEAEISAAQQQLRQLSHRLEADAVARAVAFPFAAKLSDAAEDLQHAYSLQASTTRLNAMRLLRAMELTKPILLEGAPGVGKSSIVMTLAQRHHKTLYRINLSEQTDLSDLFGADLPNEMAQPGQPPFIWRDGAFTQAMQEGAWVLLDELNLATQQVLEGLNACFDHRASVYIPELDRTLTCHPDFRVFATQNPHHQGGGRKGLPKSFLNRFTQVQVESLLPGDSVQIVKLLHGDVPDALVEKLVALTHLLAAALDTGRLGAVGGPWEFNLRDILRLCMLLDTINRRQPPRGYDALDPAAADARHLSQQSEHLLDALNILYVRKFRTPIDQAFVLKAIARVFGVSVRRMKQRPAYRINDHVVAVGCTQLPRLAGTWPQTSSAYHQHLLLQAHLPAYESLLACVEHNWVAILTGESGSGKTDLVHTLAQLCRMPLKEMTMHPGMDSMELLGSFEQVNRERSYGSLQTAFETFRHTLTHDALTGQLAGQLDPQAQMQLLSQFYHLSRDVLAAVRSGRLHQALEALPLPYTHELASLRAVMEAIRQQDQLKEVRGQFCWVNSLLITAITEGHWLLVNDINLCPAPVLDRLNGLMETRGTLTLNERGLVDGELLTITPHPNFRMFFTMNPMYGECSRAVRNRGVEIWMDPLRQTLSADDLRAAAHLAGLRLPCAEPSSSSDDDAALLAADATTLTPLALLQHHRAMLYTGAFRRPSSVAAAALPNPAVTGLNTMGMLATAPETAFVSRIAAILRRAQRYEQTPGRPASLLLFVEQALQAASLPSVRHLLAYLAQHSTAPAVAAWVPRVAALLRQLGSLAASAPAAVSNLACQVQIAYNALCLASLASAPTARQDDRRVTNLATMLLQPQDQQIRQMERLSQADRRGFRCLRAVHDLEARLADALPPADRHAAFTYWRLAFVMGLIYAVAASEPDSDETMAQHALRRENTLRAHVQELVKRLAQCDTIATFASPGLLAPLKTFSDKPFFRYVLHPFELPHDVVSAIAAVTQTSGPGVQSAETVEALLLPLYHQAWLAQRIDRKQALVETLSLLHAARVAASAEGQFALPTTMIQTAQQLLIETRQAQTTSLSLEQLDADKSWVECGQIAKTLSFMIHHALSESVVAQDEERLIDRVLADPWSLPTRAAVTAHLAVLVKSMRAVSDIEPWNRLRHVLASPAQHAFLPAVLNELVIAHERQRRVFAAHFVGMSARHALMHYALFIKPIRAKTGQTVTVDTATTKVLAELVARDMLEKNAMSAPLYAAPYVAQRQTALLGALHHLDQGDAARRAMAADRIDRVVLKFVMDMVRAFHKHLAAAAPIAVLQQHVDAGTIPSWTALLAEALATARGDHLQSMIQKWWLPTLLPLLDAGAFLRGIDPASQASNGRLWVAASLAFLETFVLPDLSRDPRSETSFRQAASAARCTGLVDRMVAQHEYARALLGNSETAWSVLLADVLQREQAKTATWRQRNPPRADATLFGAMATAVRTFFGQHLDALMAEEFTGDAGAQLILNLENFCYYVATHFELRLPDVAVPVLNALYGLRRGVRLVHTSPEVVGFASDAAPSTPTPTAVALWKDPWNQILPLNVYQQMDQPQTIRWWLRLFLRSHPRHHDVSVSQVRCNIELLSSLLASCVTLTRHGYVAATTSVVLQTTLMEWLGVFWHEARDAIQHFKDEKAGLYTQGKSTAADVNELQQQHDDAAEMDEELAEVVEEYFPVQDEELDLIAAVDDAARDQVEAAKKRRRPASPNQRFWDEMARLIVTVDRAALLGADASSTGMTPTQPSDLVNDFVQRIACGFHASRQLDTLTATLPHLLLNPATNGTGAATPDVLPNFYKDPAPEEVRKVVPVLDHLAARLAQLLEQFPEHTLLEAIVRIVNRIGSYDVTSPISRFMTGLQTLLMKCQTWEDLASREVSLRTYMSEVTGLVVTWRKIELGNWHSLLKQEEAKAAFQSLNLYFPLIRLVLSPVSRQFKHPWRRALTYVQKRIDAYMQENANVAIDASQPLVLTPEQQRDLEGQVNQLSEMDLSDLGETDDDDADDAALQAHYTEIWRSVEEMMSSASIGEYAQRLQLITLVAKRLMAIRATPAIAQCLARVDHQFALRVENLLWQIHDYYAFFLPEIEKHREQQVAPIKKELQGFVRVASWKDVNVYALQESSMKNRFQLSKAVKNYRRILASPATVVLQSVLNRADAPAPCLTPTHMDQLTATWAARVATPAAETPARADAMVTKVASKAERWLHASAHQLPVATRAVAMLASCITQIQELRDDALKLNPKTNGSACNAHRLSCRRALADALKLVRYLGVSESLSVPVMEQRVQKRTEQLPAFPHAFDAAVLDALALAAPWDAVNDAFAHFSGQARVLAVAYQEGDCGGDMKAHDKSRLYAVLLGIYNTTLRNRGSLIRSLAAVAQAQADRAHLTHVFPACASTADVVRNPVHAEADVAALAEQARVLATTVTQALPIWHAYAKHGMVADAAVRRFQILGAQLTDHHQQLARLHPLDAPAFAAMLAAVRAGPVAWFAEATALITSQQLTSLNGLAQTFQSVQSGCESVFAALEAQAIADSVPADDTWAATMAELVQTMQLAMQRAVKLEMALAPADESKYVINEYEAQHHEWAHFSQWMNQFPEATCATLFSHVVATLKRLPHPQLTAAQAADVQRLLRLCDVPLAYVRDRLALQTVFLTAQVDLGLQLGKLMASLFKHGFCTPKPQESEAGGDDGDGQVTDGTGLGDGEGQKDVSDEIENEAEVDKPAESRKEQPDAPRDEDEEQPEGIDFDDGDMGDLENVEMDLGDDDSDVEDNTEDLDDHMGQAEPEAEAVDQQLWDKDDPEDDATAPKEDNDKEVGQGDELAAAAESSETQERQADQKEPKKEQPQAEASDEENDDHEKPDKEQINDEDDQVEDSHHLDIKKQKELTEMDDEEDDDGEDGDDEKPDADAEDDKPHEMPSNHVSNPLEEPDADNADDAEDAVDSQADPDELPQDGDPDDAEMEEEAGAEEARNAEQDDDAEEDREQSDADDVDGPDAAPIDIQPPQESGDHAENDATAPDGGDDDDEAPEAPEEDSSLAQQGDHPMEEIQTKAAVGQQVATDANEPDEEAQDEQDGETEQVDEADTTAMSKSATGEIMGQNNPMDMEDTTPEQRNLNDQQDHGEQKANPFRNLGDATQRWMENLQNLRDAEQKAPEESTPQVDDVQTADQAPEFEYAADGASNDAEMPQALGTATEDQSQDFSKQPQDDEDAEDAAPQAPEPDAAKPESPETAADAGAPPPSHRASTKTDSALEEPNADDNDATMDDATQVDKQRMDDVLAMVDDPAMTAAADDAAADAYTAGDDDDDAADKAEPLETEHALEEFQVRQLVSDWQTSHDPELATRMWTQACLATQALAFQLCEQLRLILEPTKATKFKGDYRTGKKLNMRKVIPYIASQYKKDRIWLRRSEPSKRTYQVMLAIDDSKSMNAVETVRLAQMSIALLTKALTLLEVGELSLVSFGAEPQQLHPFDMPFTNETGPSLFQKFTFAQTSTDVYALMGSMFNALTQARMGSHTAGSGDIWQLQIIVSDGLCENHSDIQALVRKGMENRIMTVFIILDAQHAGQSITGLTRVQYQTKNGQSKMQLTKYMDTFPFDFFIVLRTVDQLPAIMCDILRQYFSIAAA